MLLLLLPPPPSLLLLSLLLVLELFFISSSKQIFFASLVFSSFSNCVEFIFFPVHVIPKIMSYSHLSGRVNAEKPEKFVFLLFFLFTTTTTKKRTQTVNDNMRIWFVKRCEGMCMFGVKLKYNTVNVYTFCERTSSEEEDDDEEELWTRWKWLWMRQIYTMIHWSQQH